MFMNQDHSINYRVWYIKKRLQTYKHCIFTRSYAVLVFWTVRDIPALIDHRGFRISCFCILLRGGSTSCMVYSVFACIVGFTRKKSRV